MVTYVAWAQALVATCSSLYYSEIAHLVPCLLCWYQRILMYPLVIIIGVSILRKDRGLPAYVLPFSILGMGFSAYHYLLQQGIIAEALAPCQAGISCTTKQIEYFGFITIPFLSFLAFTLITVCMMIMIRKSQHE
ncbi:disulfide bond formation protein B [Patescibacteria group bacterium]|nr:disulfide bond formation protein B [Patescibacteria group bacterium]